MPALTGGVLFWAPLLMILFPRKYPQWWFDCRMVTWLAPGGWLVLEEPDFGLWTADADPLWATSPQTTQAAFPDMAMSQGRSLLRQIHQLGLQDVGADAEIDIIQTRGGRRESHPSHGPPRP